jgi:2-polyprenyl-3-methyl-5-hydroxy-6-metoxy-1,4-benzoquinol methylase
LNSTIKVEHYRKLAAEAGEGGTSYRGLPILANRGLHEHVAAMLVKSLPPGATILELGAGSGALSLRLADHGFNVTAIDYVAESFRATHDLIRFVQTDLNQKLPEEMASRFDVVAAVEIVEHLENIRHSVRLMASALKPGGRLILTTPNICNPKSLITFLCSGRFDLFLPRHYEKDGHINPVPWFVLHEALQESHFEQIALTSFKSAAFSLKGILGRSLQCLCFWNPAPKGKILVARAVKCAG